MKKSLLLLLLMIISLATFSESASTNNSQGLSCDFYSTQQTFLLPLMGDMLDMAQAAIALTIFTGLTKVIKKIRPETPEGQAPQPSRLAAWTTHALSTLSLLAVIKSAYGLFDRLLFSGTMDSLINNLQKHVLSIQNCPPTKSAP